jgi:protein ImuA
VSEGAKRQTPVEQIVQQLADRLRERESARRSDDEPLSTGVAAWDQRLPHGGLRRGSVVEWLAESVGDGAGALALLSAREACRTGRLLVVIEEPASGDRPRLYPPVLDQHRPVVDRRDVVFVRPADMAETLWAAEQALRCPAVGAVWSWFEKLADGSGRRLQLAAEAGGSLGIFLRPASARGEPSWADVRFFVQPTSGRRGRRLYVEVLRARGAWPGQSVDLEIDDETGAVHLAAELADSAEGFRAAR